MYQSILWILILLVFIILIIKYARKRSIKQIDNQNTVIIVKQWDLNMMSRALSIKDTALVYEYRVIFDCTAITDADPQVIVELFKRPLGKFGNTFKIVANESMFIDKVKSIIGDQQKTHNLFIKR